MSKGDRVFRVGIDINFECDTLQEACDAMSFIQDTITPLFQPGGALENYKRNEDDEYNSISSFFRGEIEKVQDL